MHKRYISKIFSFLEGKIEINDEIHDFTLEIRVRNKNMENNALTYIGTKVQKIKENRKLLREEK